MQHTPFLARPGVCFTCNRFGKVFIPPSLICPDAGGCTSYVCVHAAFQIFPGYISGCLSGRTLNHVTLKVHCFVSRIPNLGILDLSCMMTLPMGGIMLHLCKVPSGR